MTCAWCGLFEYLRERRHYLGFHWVLWCGYCQEPTLAREWMT